MSGTPEQPQFAVPYKEPEEFAEQWIRGMSRTEESLIFGHPRLRRQIAGAFSKTDRRGQLSERDAAWVEDKVELLSALAAPQDPEHPDPRYESAREFGRLLVPLVWKDAKQEDQLRLYHEVQNAQLSATLTERRRGRYDPLTGLFDRRAWQEQVAQGLIERQGATRLAILFFDIDQFKPVNDLISYDKGDEMIAMVGSILRTYTRKGDLVSRLNFATEEERRLYRGTAEAVAGRQGGDEFAVALSIGEETFDREEQASEDEPFEESMLESGILEDAVDHPRRRTERQLGSVTRVRRYVQRVRRGLDIFVDANPQIRELSINPGLSVGFSIWEGGPFNIEHHVRVASDRMHSNKEIRRRRRFEERPPENRREIAMHARAMRAAGVIMDDRVTSAMGLPSDLTLYEEL